MVHKLTRIDMVNTLYSDAIAIVAVQLGLFGVAACDGFGIDVGLCGRPATGPSSAMSMMRGGAGSAVELDGLFFLPHEGVSG